MDGTRHRRSASFVGHALGGVDRPRDRAHDVRRGSIGSSSSMAGGRPIRISCPLLRDTARRCCAIAAVRHSSARSRSSSIRPLDLRARRPARGRRPTPARPNSRASATVEARIAALRAFDVADWLGLTATAHPAGRCRATTTCSCRASCSRVAAPRSLRDASPSRRCGRPCLQRHRPGNLQRILRTGSSRISQGS